MFLRITPPPVVPSSKCSPKWSDLAQNGADCWEDEEHEKLGSLPIPPFLQPGVMVIWVLYSTRTQMVLYPVMTWPICNQKGVHSQTALIARGRGFMICQGRSLTMGREGPGPPPVFGSDHSKSMVVPALPLFHIKGAQNSFGSLGPSSFKSMTTPL